MRENDNYNIITGEKRTFYPSVSHNSRFASLDLLRQQKLPFATDRKPLPLPLRRLGTSQDHDLFNYTHNGRDKNLNAYAHNTPKNNYYQTKSKLGEDRFSLVNASNMSYNIISHTINQDSRSPPNVFLCAHFSGIILESRILCQR